MFATVLLRATCGARAIHHVYWRQVSALSTPPALLGSEAVSLIQSARVQQLCIESKVILRGHMLRF